MAHQLSEMYTKNVIIGIHAEFRSGMKLRTEPWLPRVASIAASWVFMLSMPPTARMANTASAITMLILTTN